MKILHIIFSFNTGGAETMLIDIANTQHRRGDDVELLVVNDNYSSHLLDTIDKGVKIRLWKRREGSQKILLALRLNLWLRLHRYDVIHAHDPKMPGLIRGLDRRLIYTNHALGISQRYMRPAIRQIAITPAVKDDVLSRNPQADVTVIPNGIRIDTIGVRDFTRQPAAGDFRIVQVGRLQYSLKGQDILIRAMGILRRSGITGISVDFIGDGPDLEPLRQLTIDEGVSDIVKFRGLMSRHDIYASYPGYDLMMHPARQEGFGLIIAEAMAAGLPVAVPNTGGPYDVIEHGRLGYTFPPDSPQAAAEAIIAIRNNYPQCLTVAREAREKATSAYGIEATVQAYSQLYSRKQS